MSVSRSPLQAPIWELIGLAALAAVYFAGYSPTDLPTTNILNAYGPMVFTLLLSASAVRMVLQDSNAIWTALFWFRTSSAVYFGVGNLVPIFGGEATIAALQSFFPFDANDLAELNEIDTVACLVVLCSANLFGAIFSGGAETAVLKQDRSAGERQLFAVGMFFLVVGGAFKYFLLIPYSFKLLNFVLPESIATIANFTYAGIYLMTVWSLEYRRSAMPLIIGFVTLNVAFGFLDLQKYEVLITLVLFGLAFLRGKITLLKLGAVFGSLLAVYIILAPAIEIGRFQFTNQYGFDGRVGFSERFDIAWSAVTLTQSYVEDDTPGAKIGALSRISYSNQSAYAIKQYDAHSPGNSLTDIFSVFVPRVLWPDKPIITQIASDFNYAITGNPLSQTSPGLFADAYWDYGWTGVIVAMILLGIFHAWLSRYAIDVLRRGQWFYFPIVLLAMKEGFRTDGYLVADIVGGGVILFSSLIILRAVVEFPYEVFLGGGASSRADLSSSVAGE